MAKIIAEFDFDSPLWESKEAEKVFDTGTDKDKIDWMLANCKLSEPCEIDEEDILYDEVIVDTGSYKIIYYDFGFIEGVRLFEV